MMESIPDRRRVPHIDVNGDTLRIFAGVTMLCFTVSMSVIQNGLLGVTSLSAEQLHELLTAEPEKMVLASWAAVLQLIGGLSIPVLSFLLTERFLNTKKYGQDLLSLLAAALISEVPYDMAMSGKYVYLPSQSMMLSLLIAFIMLYGLRLFAASKGVQIVIVLAALLWGSFFRAEFAPGLILLTAVFYLFRGEPKKRAVCSCIVGLLYVTAPISHFVWKRYNGCSGHPCGMYIFMAAYPLHLLVLSCIGRMI